MTLKLAYFQPIVMALDTIPPVEFTKIFSLAQTLHTHRDLNDAGDTTLSVRGGSQVQVYPNDLNLDVGWLKHYLETVCQAYMDVVTQQSGHPELIHCKPVVTSIWTIKQTAGDYQEMHSHPNGHLSGNMYISVPDLDEETKNSSDAQILFQLPQTKDIRRFVMQDTWKYAPQAGSIIVFPSHIPHTVYPWKGTGERIVMAFDAVLTPKDQGQ